MRVIVSEWDIRKGTKALRRACPHMRRLHETVGEPPLRRNEPGFKGLAKIIVAQQVSAKSAEAIWRRTACTVKPFRPAVVLTKTNRELKAAGLSAPKIRTLVALSEAISGKRLSLRRLEHATEDEVRARLTAIHGIGPWTANIYTLFCLGRADAWAAGDLALRSAVQSVLDLKDRPGADALEEIAERWRPWRGVAARLLWAWYAHPAYKVPKTSARGG